MTVRHLRAFAVLAFAVAICAAPSALQQSAIQPQVGQPGKDVVWVPTADALVQKMLDLAQVTADDYVIDLGSGDGRTVIAAAKRGARALGVEYEPPMVELSRRRAAEAQVTNATFVQADLFQTDLSQATVITMFLLPRLNLQLRPRLLELKPGTRIVSNTFTMDDWSPDDQAVAGTDEGCSTWCSALLWIVPAKIEGTWRSADSALTLRQRFQMLEGTLSGANGTPSQPVSGKLRGTDVVINANGVLYEGRVQGETIRGTVTSGSSTRPWTATKAGG